MPNITEQNQEINNRLQEETAEEYEDMQDAMGNYVGSVTSQVVNMDTINPAAISHDLLSRSTKNNPKFDFSDFQEDARKNEKKANDMVNKLPKKSVAKPKSSPENLIEDYKEKIRLIEWVSECTTIYNLPDDLSKTGRDILIQLQKEIEAAKNKAIDLIQKM